MDAQKHTLMTVLVNKDEGVLVLSISMQNMNTWKLFKIIWSIEKVNSTLNE